MLWDSRRVFVSMLWDSRELRPLLWDSRELRPLFWDSLELGLLLRESRELEPMLWDSGELSILFLDSWDICFQRPAMYIMLGLDNVRSINTVVDKKNGCSQRPGVNQSKFLIILLCSLSLLKVSLLSYRTKLNNLYMIIFP